MARKTQNPTNAGNDQEEMTAIVIRLKGGGETLRKGFETLSQAFAALGQTTVVQQRLPGRAANELPEAGTDGNLDRGDANDQVDLEEVSEPVRESSGAKGKRKPPPFLPGFNLDGDGTKWKEFAASKQPETEMIDI